MSARSRVDWSSPTTIRLVALFLASPLLILLVDGMFSRTSLITQLDPALLWTARGLGAVDGLLFFAVFRRLPNYSQGGGWRGTFLLLAFMFFMAAGFDAFAWRAVELWTFGRSTSAFEQAVYPVKSVEHGRKGSRATIHIDPFNTDEETEIPISAYQYADLQEQTGKLCVTVQQRRSSTGRIQIKTDGSFTLTEPAIVPVGSC